MSQAQNNLNSDALHPRRQHRAAPPERRDSTSPDAPSLQRDLAGPRPKTAPSTTHHHQQRTVSLPPSVAVAPPTSAFSIPRIAIFKDFSLHSLRARVAIRKPPTSSDLSDGAKRPRRLSSTSTSTSTSTSSLRQQPHLPYTHPQPAEPLKSPHSRPPAWHSCNGIETAFGPPPALITRAASYNSDLSRRAQSPATQTFLQQKSKPYNVKTPTKDHALEKKDSFLECTSPEPLDAATLPKSPKPVSPHALDAIMDRSAARNRNNGYLDDGASAYTDGLSPTADGASGGEQEDSGRSAEDLFLNLADDSPADSRAYDSQSRLERRLVCLLFAFHTHHKPPADAI
jgi:hypothetical protein